MKINLLGKKKIIWLGCFLYTTNFYASPDSPSRTNSILQIKNDIASLIQSVSSRDSFGITNKLSSLYTPNTENNQESGIFTKISKLPANKIKTILDILGCDPDQSDPNSVSKLLDPNSQLTSKTAGFNGDFPGEIGSVHSRLNEILNIIAHNNILDFIGNTTDTALENGRTIWARIKFLYSDLIKNDEGEITNKVNTVYSTAKQLMSNDLEESKKYTEAIITAKEEVVEEDIQLYPFSNAKQQIIKLEEALKGLGDTYGNSEESSGLNDSSIKTLEEDIKELNRILTPLENPKVTEKFANAQEALNKITNSLLSNNKTFKDICYELKNIINSAFLNSQEAKESQSQIRQSPLEEMSVGNFRTHITRIFQLEPDSISAEEKTKFNTYYDILNNFAAIDNIKNINNKSTPLSIFSNNDQDTIINLSAQYAPIFSSESILSVSTVFGDTKQIQSQIKENALNADTTQTIEMIQTNLDKCKKLAKKLDHSKNVIAKLEDAIAKSSTFSQSVNDDCVNIADNNLTNQVTNLQKTIDQFTHDPEALALLGNLNNGILYKPYKIIPLLHLVQNSLTSLVYSFDSDSLSKYSQNVETLLERTKKVIEANNRGKEIKNLEDTLVQMYVAIVSSLSTELSSNTNFTERSDTLTELEAFKTQNSQINAYTLSNLIIADIPNISRIQSYTWPKLTSAETVTVGNFIQPGLTLMNCTHKIRQALSVYPLFLQIGYSTDNQDSLSLIGRIKSINKQIEAKNTNANPYPLINYNSLILIRDLIEMYPGVSFIKQDKQKTFIQWLTQTIGSGADVPASDSIENPAALSEDPSAPSEAPSTPVENPSDPVEDPSAPVENPSDSVEDPSQNKFNSLFADISKIQKNLENISTDPDTSSNVLLENINTINTKFQMISTSLNAIINAKIAPLNLTLLEEDWYDYGEIFKIIMNNDDISHLNPNDYNKLLQELYARPLLFKINGIPNIDEDSLLSQIQQQNNSESNTVTQSWIHLNVIVNNSQKQSNLSILNFISRTILESAPYLNTSFLLNGEDESAPETIISQAIKEKIPTKEKNSTSTPGKDAIYQFTDSFYNLIKTFFLKTESPDGSAITYALFSPSSSPSSAPLITTQPTDTNITNALQTLGIPHTDFLDRLTLVYNVISNAQDTWRPIRLEKIIDKLYAIQKNLSTLYETINDVETPFDFEKTINVKMILGTSLEDHRASSSIFGCLNNIVTECSAQLLVNLIGTPTDYQEDSLFARLYQREMEAIDQDISKNIQNIMSACNELSNRILTNAINLAQDIIKTPTDFSATATSIYSLAETISLEETLDAEKLIDTINNIYASSL